MRIGIAYATQHGHTARVAAHMAAAVRATGHEAELIAVLAESTPRSLERCDALMLAAPVYASALPAPFLDFVGHNYDAIHGRPNLLCTIGLTMAGPRPDASSARRAAEALTTTTGWVPDEMRSIAGALTYTDYSWFMRMIMRVMAHRSGLDTDTSRDHVYTDWDDVERFTVEFVARAEAEGRVVPEVPPAYAAATPNQRSM